MKGSSNILCRYANTKERAKRKCSFVVYPFCDIFPNHFSDLDFKLFLGGSLKVVPSLTNRIKFLLLYVPVRVLPLKDSDVVFPIRSTAQPPLGTRENEPEKKKKKKN